LLVELGQGQTTAIPQEEKRLGLVPRMELEVAGDMDDRIGLF
jgi:hypothetical protein